MDAADDRMAEWEAIFAYVPPPIRYTRIERLHFRIFGRWPERVVQRRLEWADELSRHARIAARDSL